MRHNKKLAVTSMMLIAALIAGCSSDKGESAEASAATTQVTGKIKSIDGQTLTVYLAEDSSGSETESGAAGSSGSEGSSEENGQGQEESHTETVYEKSSGIQTASAAAADVGTIKLAAAEAKPSSSSAPSSGSGSRQAKQGDGGKPGDAEDDSVSSLVFSEETMDITITDNTSIVTVLSDKTSWQAPPGSGSKVSGGTPDQETEQDAEGTEDTEAKQAAEEDAHAQTADETQAAEGALTSEDSQAADEAQSSAEPEASAEQPSGNAAASGSEIGIGELQEGDVVEVTVVTESGEAELIRVLGYADEEGATTTDESDSDLEPDASEEPSGDGQAAPEEQAEQSQEGAPAERSNQPESGRPAQGTPPAGASAAPSGGSSGQSGTDGAATAPQGKTDSAAETQPSPAAEASDADPPSGAGSEDRGGAAAGIRAKVLAVSGSVLTVSEASQGAPSSGAPNGTEGYADESTEITIASDTKIQKMSFEGGKMTLTDITAADLAAGDIVSITLKEGTATAESIQVMASAEGMGRGEGGPPGQSEPGDGS